MSRIQKENPLNTSDLNPAALLSEFWEEHFVRMSCGSMVLSTKRTQHLSKVLAGVRTIDQRLVGKYIQGWKDMGFLKKLGADKVF